MGVMQVNETDWAILVVSLGHELPRLEVRAAEDPEEQRIYLDALSLRNRLRSMLEAQYSPRRRNLTDQLSLVTR